MPTATDFDAAARDLDAAVERLQSFTWGLVRTVDPTAMSGSSLTALVDRSVETLLTETAAAGTQCALLAGLCRQRAEICRQYDRLWAGYESRIAEFQRIAATASPGEYVGSPPMPPPPPAPWADPR